MSRRLESLSEVRSFHEKQFSTLEQLPAVHVSSFLREQRIAAATKLQAWWRGRKKRAEYGQLRRRAQLESSAIRIQRAFREHRKQKQREPSSRATPGYPPVAGEEREMLQREITARREERRPPRLTDAELRARHDEMQVLLWQFYLRAPEERREAEKRKILCSAAEQDCALLLAAPRLATVTEKERKKFVSGSEVVRRMAAIAHREELRATELPWWKRPLPADSADNILQLL